MKKILILITILSYNLLNAQIYELKPNEEIIYSYILDSKNYAFVIKKLDTQTQEIFYDILHKKNNDINRMEGFRDFLGLKILTNGTITANMTIPSVAKDMYIFIYGDEKKYFDEIEKVIYSKDTTLSIVFAKNNNKGLVLINNVETDTQYDELFDAKVSNGRFAYSYVNNSTNYINIDGTITQLENEAQNITFSEDGKRLVYTENNENGVLLVEDDIKSDVYASLGNIAFSPNNMLAYSAVLINTNTNTNDNTNTQTNSITNINNINRNPQFNIENMTNNIILNNNIDYLQNIENPETLIPTSNMENYEAITMLGPSNTIALVNISTNTNSVSRLLDAYNSYITNNSTNENMIEEKSPTVVFLNGRKIYEFENIEELSFSPNSKQLLFVISENDEYRLSIQGQLSEVYTSLPKYMYSPNSELFILNILEEETNFIYVNYELYYEFESLNDIYVSDYSLVFNINKDDRKMIVSKGFESPSYNDILNFLFSKDMKSFSFTATRAKKNYQYYLNTENPQSIESLGYDYISHVFLSEIKDENFLSLALRDNNLYLLKNAIEQKP